MTALRNYHRDGTLPDSPRAIWVFGSNLAGRHGAGAAKVARLKFGAVPGFGRGSMGQSYAIPTKDHQLKTRAYGLIMDEVREFIVHAHRHRDYLFWVTRVGCGLAGYSDYDMSRLFRDAPKNCSFAEEWKPWLE